MALGWTHQGLSATSHPHDLPKQHPLSTAIACLTEPEDSLACMWKPVSCLGQATMALVLTPRGYAENDPREWLDVDTDLLPSGWKFCLFLALVFPHV